jgi:acetyltransferase-like isoleucine patch superfamily enzyme
VTRYWDACGPVIGTCRWFARAWTFGRNRTATRTWRLALASLGRASAVQAGVFIERPRNVWIGEGCLVTKGASLTTETSHGELHLHDGVQVNRDVRLDYSGNLRLLDGALVSEGAVVMTHSHGHDPHSPPRALELTIGRNAWIGAYAIILPGVHAIGDGAVVGAGAIVRNDVAPNQIVAGNPARPIGMRELGPRPSASGMERAAG